jgi:prepilin signal peptidase PulO-like enzyme (type II secretory pathway)
MVEAPLILLGIFVLRKCDKCGTEMEINYQGAHCPNCDIGIWYPWMQTVINRAYTDLPLHYKPRG